MKKLFMVLTLVFLLCFTFGCQQGEEVAEEPVVDVEAEKQIVAKLVVDSMEAEGQKDIDAVMGIFADNVIFQPPNEPQFQGKELYQKHLEDVLFQMTVVSLDVNASETKVAQSGDVAYCAGTYLLIFEGDEGNVEFPGKFLYVLNKINDEWKVVLASWSGDQLFEP
jgi:ketosteroid isomerase-like protein